MFQETTFELSPGNALGSSSNYSSFGFACAEEPKDGKIELIQAYHTCREGLMSSMRTRLREGSKQPTDKMRIVFRWAGGTTTSKADLKATESWVKRSVPVLQAFDRIAGWPLTRVYKIETPHDDWLRAYYFHSSRRWMKSSYLVSLYTMLVRMCKDKRIDGFKDFDGLIKVLNKIFSSSSNLISDHSYVKDSMPYWEAIMTGYPKLFRKRKLPYYWDNARLGGNSGSAEGLQYLVKGDTKYTDIRSEMIKIKKQLDSKKS
jgi:hypothetical protein